MKLDHSFGKHDDRVVAVHIPFKVDPIAVRYTIHCWHREIGPRYKKDRFIVITGCYKIIIFEGDTAKLGGKYLENSARHGTNPNATLINYRHPLTHTRLVTLGFIVKVFSRLVNYIIIWSTRFATVGCIRNAPTVENSNLPTWMQQTEKIDQEVMDTSIQEPEFSHEIKVELVWDPSVPFKGKQALKNPLGIFSDLFSDSM